MSPPKRRRHGCLVDDGSASQIEQAGAGFHASDAFGIEKPLRPRSQGAMQGDEVAAFQQRFEGKAFFGTGIFSTGNLADQDFHPEETSHLGHPPSYAAIA